MTGQGWESADFQCGTCGASWTSTTEPEYVGTVRLHAQVHRAARVLQGIVPGLTPDAALSAAAQMVGSIVASQARPEEIGALRPAYAFEATRG